MVLWEDWLIGVADAMGFGSGAAAIANAGMMVSLLFTLGMILLVAIVTTRIAAMTMIGFVSLIFFTVLGWLNYWVLLLLTLLVAGGIAARFREWFGGGR